MTGLPDLVVVVDDDAELRASIEFLLSTAGRRCLGHASAEALLAAGLPPGTACVVADVRLGEGIDGVALVEALHRRGEPVPVVVITGHGDVPLAVRAMRAGAVDFIEKPFAAERLLAAIVEAASRQAPADPAAAEAGARVAGLTPRERQVLQRLVAGEPNKLVAHGLGISPRTVETYRASIMQKLGCRAFAEAVRVALAAGLGP
ncbi:response regulator transcription factor [Paracraurococcus lichenis]|uniref:Response regulator n=1 Tax=Paracraurococcus lichenis TaxID=3064888 RepID=A0ABT9E6J2_9PROT|nr:response regulator [Paracraurococcus sp. LOR1-02]MDO9711793.1 response regulator [Paracraurococcus sp. LOR1-02]